MSATTVYAADFGKKATRVPEGGNAFCESYRWVSTAIEAASTIYYGIIPAGVEINAVKQTHGTNASSVTEKLGYSPVDATDGPTEVLDYWWGATAVTTAGAVTSVAHPITFNFPVKLVGTTAGATMNADVVVNVTISGKVVGVP